MWESEFFKETKNSCDLKVLFLKIVCFIDISSARFLLNLNMNKNVIIKHFHGYHDNVNCKICFLNTQDTFIDKINQQTEHFVLNNLQLPRNQIFKWSTIL